MNEVPSIRASVLRKYLHQLRSLTAEIERDLRSLPESSETEEIQQTPESHTALEQVIVSILKKHPEGIGLSEVAGKVLESGYRTSAKNFRGVVYQCLYKHKDKIEHTTDGKYRIR